MSEQKWRNFIMRNGKQIAINVCSDNTAYTVTTRMSAAGVNNLTRGGIITPLLER